MNGLVVPVRVLVDNKPTKYTKIAQSRRGVGAERREPPGAFIERFCTTIDVQRSDIVQDSNVVPNQLPRTLRMERNYEPIVEICLWNN